MEAKIAQQKDESLKFPNRDISCFTHLPRLSLNATFHLFIYKIFSISVWVGTRDCIWDRLWDSLPRDKRQKRDFFRGGATPRRHPKRFLATIFTTSFFYYRGVYEKLIKNKKNVLEKNYALFLLSPGKYFSGSSCSNRNPIWINLLNKPVAKIFNALSRS